MSRDTDFESQMKLLKNFAEIASCIGQFNPGLHDTIGQRISDMMFSIIEQSLIQPRERQDDDRQDDDKETPIYEKLSPGEVLIISKDEDSILVAKNKDGDINIERVQFVKGDKSSVKITDIQ